MKKIVASIALLVALSIGVYCYANAATIVSGAGTPFYIFTVTTGADVIVDVPDNDVLFLHTGIQSDGSTASVAGDYVTIMNAFAGDGVTATTMDGTYAAGAKLNVPSASSATFRGCDCSFCTASGTKQIRLRAVNHGATVQIIKGSQYGSKQ